MFQMKEQNKIPEGELGEMRQTIYLMEFEVMIIKMLNELRKRMDEHSEKLNRGL